MPPERRGPDVRLTQAAAVSGGEGSGPVYVGGLDRSGKTTMAAFLGSHPRIAIPAVGSNMWTYFYRRYGDLSVDANLDACLDAMMRYKHVRFLQPDVADIRARFASGSRTYAELFSLFLKQFAERRGKPRWGAQTGLIERYAPLLFEAYPGVKIIHMIRDPRDRYEASLALWPNGKGRAGGAVARWTYSESLARRHERRWPERYRVVRFEDLVADPVAALRDTCMFLGEDYHPDMLGMAASPRHRDRMAERAAGPGQVLSTDFIGRHRGRIDPTEIAFIELHARRAMRRRGYLPSNPPLEGTAWARFAVRVWPDQAARMVAWRVIEEMQQRFPQLVKREPGARMIVEAAG